MYSTFSTFKKHKPLLSLPPLSSLSFLSSGGI